MPAGRPTKMTPDTVKKLEQAFLWGCTDEEACCYADITRATLHNYCEANPEYFDRKQVLKNNPFMKARKVLNDALDKNDTFTANKMIDRRDGTKNKQELTGKDGEALDLTWSFKVVDPKATKDA